MSQIKPLSAELQKVAIEELGEVPARIDEDLQDLKSWIHQQPHLKARTDDQFLVQFLRGCKYSLERAKEKIDHFYSLRARHPEMCSITDVDDPKWRKFQNTRFYTSLPTPLNGSGPRIMVTQINVSLQDFTTNDIFQYAISGFEVMIMGDPYACINGVMIVFDFAQAPASFLKQLTPSFAKNLITFFVNTTPIRIKSMYFINLTAVAEKIVNFLVQLLPEKVRQRIFVCGSNVDALGEHLPKKYLPQELGGENGSVDALCAEYHKVWDEYREYFKQNAEYGTDERLRLGKPFDSDGQLGYEGSFRKLNVD